MTTTIRISDSDGLLSTIPVLLGFHPTDSVVIAGVKSGRNTVGPVARFDIATYRTEPEVMADYVAKRLGQHVESCLIVFYGLDEDLIGFPEMVDARGLDVLGVEFTGNEPHPLHSAAHAEYVVGGGIVAPSREAIRAQVEFDAAAGNAPDWDLVTLMRDVDARDAYLMGNIRAARQPLQRVLATCRQMPDYAEGVANLCAVASILAYRCGGGALAHMCLERALRIDPEHTLSKLMADVFNLAPAPETFDDLLSDLAG